jgi:hypothetical protein
MSLGQRLGAIIARYRTFFGVVSNPYRPELHYMRGPGPKWRAKHASATPADTVSVPALAHAKS